MPICRPVRCRDIGCSPDLANRSLRPGGLNLTRQLLESLAIRSSDAVVEFAPGLGVTARMALNLPPASYTAIEDDEAAAARVRHLLAGACQQCLVGSAAKVPLPDHSATVIYGEAMLTMQGTEQKHQIVREADPLCSRDGRLRNSRIVPRPGRRA